MKTFLKATLAFALFLGASQTFVTAKPMDRCIRVHTNPNGTKTVSEIPCPKK